MSETFRRKQYREAEPIPAKFLLPDGSIVDELGNFEIKSGSDSVGNWVKFPNGLIIQWGNQRFSKSVGGALFENGPQINFPIQFQKDDVCIQLTHIEGNQFNMSANTISKSGFIPRYRNVNNNTTATIFGCSWLAIGY